VSLNGRRVELLARAIVNRLEDRGLVEFRDAEAGILAAEKTLAGHLALIDSFEREARQRLGTPASDRKVDEEMRRLAAERGVAL